MNRNYITCEKEYNRDFTMVPRDVQYGKGIYRSLSSDAIRVYGVLLELSRISLQNNLVTKGKGAYVFMTRDKIMGLCNCCKNKAIKIMRELEAVELIEDMHQGRNKANMIYVKMPVTSVQNKQEVKKAKKERSQKAKNYRKMMKALNTSIKTKKDIERRQDQVIKAKSDWIKNLSYQQEMTCIQPELLENVRDRIEYDYFKEEENAAALHVDPGFIDTIVYAIAEMETAPSTKISGFHYPCDELTEILHDVDSGTIMDFISHLQERFEQDNRGRLFFARIKHVKAYIKAALVNFVQEQQALFFELTSKSRPKRQEKRSSYDLEELDRLGLQIPAFAF